MKTLYTATVVVLSFLLLVSFSNNPPDGRTGAPGDGLCSDCHQQNNISQDGNVEVTGFPEQITPGEIYPLMVVVSNPDNTAELAGFQMTILDGAGAAGGTMMNPGSNSTITVANGKQYFEHNPAVSLSGSVTWTVDWQAPEGPIDAPMFYYAAGNVSNDNNQNSGDLIVTTTGEGVLTVTSSTGDIAESDLEVFPNPTSDVIRFRFNQESPSIRQYQIFSFTGQEVDRGQEIIGGSIDVSQLTSGMYVLRAQINDEWHTVKWNKH